MTSGSGSAASNGQYMMVQEESLDISGLNRHPMAHDDIWGDAWSSSAASDRLGGNTRGAACGRGRSISSPDMAIAGRITQDCQQSVDVSAEEPIWLSMRRKQMGGSGVGDLMSDGAAGHSWTDRPQLQQQQQQQQHQQVAQYMGFSASDRQDVRSFSQPGMSQFARSPAMLQSRGYLTDNNEPELSAADIRRKQQGSAMGDIMSGDLIPTHSVGSVGIGALPPPASAGSTGRLSRMDPRLMPISLPASPGIADYASMGDGNALMLQQQQQQQQVRAQAQAQARAQAQAQAHAQAQAQQQMILQQQQRQLQQQQQLQQQLQLRQLQLQQPHQLPPQPPPHGALPASVYYQPPPTEPWDAQSPLQHEHDPAGPPGADPASVPGTQANLRARRKAGRKPQLQGAAGSRAAPADDLERQRQRQRQQEQEQWQQRQFARPMHPTPRFPSQTPQPLPQQQPTAPPQQQAGLGVYGSAAASSAAMGAGAPAYGSQAALKARRKAGRSPPQAQMPAGCVSRPQSEQETSQSRQGTPSAEYGSQAALKARRAAQRFPGSAPGGPPPGYNHHQEFHC